MKIVNVSSVVGLITLDSFSEEYCVGCGGNFCKDCLEAETDYCDECEGFYCDECVHREHFLGESE